MHCKSIFFRNTHNNIAENKASAVGRQLNGNNLAVGNADPRAHEPFTKVDSHPLYFGKAVAVVRRDKGASGPIVLKAAVKGLKPAEVEFR